MSRRILLLNDLGFQYGAGIAAARQAASLLLAGHTVGALAWEPGSVPDSVLFTRPGLAENWLGMRRLRHLDSIPGMTEEGRIEGVVGEAARFRPDTIIVGNLHAAGWGLELLLALRRIGANVVAYVHDCHLFTGRCAYPRDCERFLSGCDEQCPTPTEYPTLAPELIHRAWQLRRELFTAENKIKVATNSDWSSSTFKKAIPNVGVCETVYLGADETVFHPSDRVAARMALNLPLDKPLLISAAVNFEDRRKGAHYLAELARVLGESVTLASFGHNATAIQGAIALPFDSDPASIAKIYQAADLFIATSTEEAFGQTLLEAQLCGCPVVAFNVGGIAEIVHNGITGHLVPAGDVPALIDAIQTLLADPDALASMGKWSRACAEARFSLQAQAGGWSSFLQENRKIGTGRVSPDIIYPRLKGETGTYRPSWPSSDGYQNEEHRTIFATTKHLPGWQTSGDSEKLYELGYFSGDVILEIGTYGGRSATAELRGALANQKRTAAPRFFGIDIDPTAIGRTRQTLADQNLTQYCHLYSGTLAEFVQQWRINPTMVFLDGDHRYEGVAADIQTLTTYLAPGTPVLVHDYLNAENVNEDYGIRRAVDEWIASGRVSFAGAFGCAALLVTQ